MSESFQTILHKRASRRGFLKAAGLSLAASSIPLSLAAKSTSGVFAEVPRGLDTTHHLPKGYSAQILLRWGDGLFKHAPSFNPQTQSAASQSSQFGYNNDYIDYFPFGGSSSHGLLGINHEYTNPELMFKGGRKLEALSAEEHRIEMAACGVSITEIKRSAGEWRVDSGHFNRRIDASTPMQLTGPAAGHARMQTSADKAGKRVLGTFANCAGGHTPWNSYLTCEENIDAFFWLGDYAGKQKQHHANFGIDHTPYHRWDLIDKRFNVAHEPNEPNRFGWVVEIDPFDPQSTPKKRTALGRFKHECATTVLNDDGRVVVYMGDDEHFQFIYKFVSSGRYRKGKAAAGNLLDHGTLYAARFREDGTTEWLPLVFGEAPLTAENGFDSQGEVLIETRRAAKLLGATPMDRPEDIAVDPQSGRVYASLTKNPARVKADHINHQAPNFMGYVLELSPPANDHTATYGQWDILLTGDADSLACPDNLAFGPDGNLWIATDGQQKTAQVADMLYSTPISGKHKGNARAFFRAPVGAEVTGPCFTPDGKTLFVSVQHPAEGSSYNSPSTRWPDFDEAQPPRPAILAISKDDGGVIGS